MRVGTASSFATRKPLGLQTIEIEDFYLHIPLMRQTLNCFSPAGASPGLQFAAFSGCMPRLYVIALKGNRQIFLPGAFDVGRAIAEGLDGAPAIPARLLLELSSDADQFLSGLNFDPTRSPHAVLTDFRDIVGGIYEIEPYFLRVLNTCLMLDMSGPNGNLSLWTWKQDLMGALRFLWHINVKAPRMRKPVLALAWTLWRKNPRSLKVGLTMAALYAHFGPFARHVVAGIERRLEREEANGAGPLPRRASAPVQLEAVAS